MKEIILKLQIVNGEDIIVVQIAGLIARRIVTEIDKNEELNKDQRIGMIRFGSRADIYFENYNTLVKVNKKLLLEKLISKKINLWNNQKKF